MLLDQSGRDVYNKHVIIIRELVSGAFKQFAVRAISIGRMRFVVPCLYLLYLS